MLDFIVNNQGIGTNFLNSPFFSSIVGGGIALCGVILANYFNKKEIIRKEKKEECATILSIVEEIKVLKAMYQPYMDDFFSLVTSGQYLSSYFLVTQDFMTVYNSNACKLGLIGDSEIRNKIIYSYTLLKRFIEQINIHKQCLDELQLMRTSFLKKHDPNFVNGDFNYIDERIRQIVSGNKNFAESIEYIQFKKSDIAQTQDLEYLSVDLKNIYNKLKEEAENIEVIAKKYCEETINDRK